MLIMNVILDHVRVTNYATGILSISSANCVAASSASRTPFSLNTVRRIQPVGATPSPSIAAGVR